MPTPIERALQKLFWTSLVLSLLLHLAGIGLLEFSWQGEEGERTYRIRMVRPPRVVFRQPELMPAPGPARPFTQMEYLPPEAGGPGRLAEEELPLSGPLPPLAGQGQGRGRPGEVTAEGSPLALREVSTGAKAERFVPGQERLRRPGELGLPYRAPERITDLLRLQDMARANKERAVVIPDLASRRDLRGYVNLARLRVYGANSGSLDDLARYMRDYTQVLTQVQPGYHEYFLSPQLLKDPIHFIFQDSLSPLRAGDYPLTYFSQEEYALLGQYLRSGGFLFIEAQDNQDKYLFLTEMRDHLEQVLGAEGRLFPLPLSHPLYTAYYDFSGGFPGEEKQRLTEASGPSWYYAGEGRPGPALPPPAPINPQLQQVPQLPALGLWGVELKGQLVAILSDLDLHVNWRLPMDPEQTGGDEPVLYSLQASTNIVVYALTRPGGKTPKLPPAAWEQRRPQAPAAQAREDTTGAEEELLDELDASLALVQTPLGRALEAGGVEVIVDGYSVELLKRGLHGVLLRNLPPGPHWVEVRYAGRSKQADIELSGDRVRTLTFSLNRFAFLTQLYLRQQEELVDLEEWQASFADLQIEEVFLGDDREKLE